MRLLGVYFSNGLLSVDYDNWKCKPDKLQAVVNLWSSRELSFIGRVGLGTSRECEWLVARILASPKQVIDSYTLLCGILFGK